MSQQRTPLYIAGAVIAALSIFGLYYAASKDKATSAPTGQAEVAPAVSAADAGPPATAAEEDANLTVLDAASAGINLASVPGGECWLDYFEQDGKAVSGETIRDGVQTQFYGWGLAGEGVDVTGMVIDLKPLDPSGTEGFIKLRTHVRRDDIAAAKGAERYRDSGFHKAGLLEGVQKGRYHLYLVLQSADRLTQCDLNRDIAVH